MRWWTGASVSFAAVVNIVQLSTASPGARSASERGSLIPSGMVQRSQRPANAISRMLTVQFAPQ